MLLNFHDQDVPDMQEYDLCIVGSGPAGMSIALEFLENNQRVVVLESGDILPDIDTQNLYQGETFGQQHYPLSDCRLRHLGGSSNCWNGWCAPFDKTDFDRKSWLPYSGWPINEADLETYYPRAGEICEIGTDDFSDSYWKKLNIEAPQFDTKKVRVCNWRESPPTRFGVKYREVLERSTNISILLNANVINIDCNESLSKAAQLQIANLNGREGVIKAKHFVLACGGIENPRLLLNSNKQAKSGLGNQHDQVGRYFMEHPYATSALVYAKPSNFHPSVEKNLNGVQVRTGFSTSAQLQEKEGVMSSMMLVNDRENLQQLFSWGQRSLPTIPKGYQRYTLMSQSEQSPDPSNRIELSNKQDRLGSQQAKMTWSLNELDKKCIEVLAKAVGTEIARLGIGRVKYADWLLDKGAYWGVQAGNHHMGTTRMGNDPQTSVVDKHCQVHGINNLHIAGSSVFTTSGWVNPTFTIVALAIRLASTLKSKM